MTTATSPDARPGSRRAGQSALVRLRRRWDGPEAARLAAALAGLAAIAAYLIIALSRLTYPFTIEWLEGNSLVEVHRILAGQQLYAAPTVGYVPDGYPPLYFAVSAAVASVTGVSYLPLRLVSLVSSLVCFALLGRLVQRETGSAAAGTAAAGMFAASYFATSTWFDVGRIDSLFLALSLAALYAARWMRNAGGAVAVGVLLAAATLTKQTGLAEGVAVLGVLALGPRRRLACAAALAEVTVLGISTLWLGLASGGWYVYYVFELMGQHALDYGAVGGFWASLLGVLGLAWGAAILGVRRTSSVLLAGCAALLVEGYAALVHSGGGVNDLLPAYLAVALFAGLSMSGRAGVLAGWLARSRAPSRPVGQAERWAVAVPALLVLTQSAVLLGGFQPARQIPGTADRAVGERLTAALRTLGGTVAIPADPGLSLLAGMAPTAHADAADDVLRASDPAAIASFTRSAEAAVAARRFSAIITDWPAAPSGFPPDLARYYRRCSQPLLAGVPSAVFQPVAGAQVRPVSVWLPRGRGSCPAAVRVLDGSR